MLPVVFFIYVADDDSPAAAGVNEFPVFQINAGVCYAFPRSTACKENKVAFAQIAFVYLVALAVLGAGGSWQSDAIYFTVYLQSHPGAVCSVFAAASRAIGRS